MFPLLSLPNELILRIIDQIHPSTLAPFACGNKKIYSFSEERLARHRYQKENYSTLVFGKDASRECTLGRHGWQMSCSFYHEDCACQFINKFIEDNSVAYYPKTLCLDTFDFKEDQSEYGLEFTLAQAVGSVFPSTLVPSIRPCPFPSEKVEENLPSDKEEENLSDIENPSCYNWDLNTALLFAILPTLQSVIILEVQDGDLLSGCVSRFIRRVVDASRRPGATLHKFDRALPLLRELTIEFDDMDDDAINDYDENLEDNITAYAPFAMLPSMHTLQGKNVTGFNHSAYDYSVFAWPLGTPKRSLSITTISFIDSAINPKTLKSFLEGFTALREFTYHHKCSPLGPIVYQPQGIVEALMTYAADTLVKLDLSAQQSELSIRQNGSQHVFSLRAFTALKYIRVDDALFVAPDWENADEESSEGQDVDETKGNDPSTSSTAQLWTLLPPTCETLNLIHYRRKTPKLFRNFLAHKESHFPKLKQITIEDTNWMGVRTAQWPDGLEPLLNAAMKTSFEETAIECCTVDSKVSYSYRERS